ncbi:MAG TPA: serine hydrolase domain-containing protein [Longimicrobium sp.]|nr:serine hydrolase domain-containing protein [Longimicrobium sp.]
MFLVRRVPHAVMLLAAAACASPPAPAPAGAPETVPAAADPRRELLDRNAAAWLRENDVPSLAVGFVENGRVAWTAVYGEQSPGVPATDTTLYNVASLTKPVAAELVLRLASAGRISLDEPLSPYWIDPDVAGDPRHQRLTPALALSHQTGFGNWRYLEDGKLRFHHDPGTRWGYSGEGYNYVGRFLEKRLGVPFEELLQQVVLGPLGIQAATTRRGWFAGRTAVPYEAGRTVNPGIREPGDWSAAGNLHVTIGGYTRFLRSVVNREGLSPEVAALRERTFVDVIASAPAWADSLVRATPNVVEVGMGLGWMIYRFRDHAILTHSGSDPGISSFVMFDPATRTGFAAFTNGANGSAVIHRVLEVLSERRDFYDFLMAVERRAAQG